MFAGHDLSCPYEEQSVQWRKRGGEIAEAAGLASKRGPSTTSRARTHRARIKDARDFAQDDDLAVTSREPCS